ncbi:hypothetical protein HBH26_16970 [Sphingomonas sp. 36D10-4-7]|uniref:Site-specific integrase n=1 Tax=Sphingomonas corticis TaxID=2722791 RepID=A0ABX1CVF7_9SPHN|nr:hypothetical protein [Sphingomonas corticis]
MAFLARHGAKHETRLSDIDESTLVAFKAWIDDPESPIFMPSENSRSKVLLAGQRILSTLMASKRWAPQLSPALKLLKNPYPNAGKDTKHTEILDDATLERLYVHAADDCERSILRFRKDRDRLKATMSQAVPLEAAGKDAFSCAAYLMQTYKGSIPVYWKIAARSKRFAPSIDKALFEAAKALLYPNLDEILPFVLLLTLMFAFNPGVVLNMTHDDYEDETLFGRERIRLKPFKPRANKNQINTVLATDDLDNPRTILRHLRDRCLRARAIVRPEWANRVFLRYSWKYNKVFALEGTDIAMRKAIARFCARHKIDVFQLKQIRPTTLDLVHEITDGNLLAMQQVANHDDPNTTREFYTSEAFQRRNEEMLAAGMLQLERKYQTAGRIDVAARHRLRSDLGSATPGFACLNPYRSPLKGERKGRLCQAYGRCPICPLAMMDPGSEHSYAYLIKLREALDEAAGRLGPPWLRRWAPVKERITVHWARIFTDPEVVKRGVALARTTIPDLPRLD